MMGMKVGQTEKFKFIVRFAAVYYCVQFFVHALYYKIGELFIWEKTLFSKVSASTIGFLLLYIFITV